MHVAAFSGAVPLTVHAAHRWPPSVALSVQLLSVQRPRGDDLA